LRLVYGQQSFHRLQFYNEAVFHQQINPVTAVQQDTLVLHGKFQLAGILKPRYFQFIRQSFFVGRFQQTRTRFPMYLYPEPDDLACKRIPLHLCSPLIVGFNSPPRHREHRVSSFLCTLCLCVVSILHRPICSFMSAIINACNTPSEKPPTPANLSFAFFQLVSFRAASRNS